MPELLSEIEEQAVALLDHSGPPTGGEDDGGIGPWRRPGGTPQRTHTTGMFVAMVGSSTFFLALVIASVIHQRDARERLDALTPAFDTVGDFRNCDCKQFNAGAGEGHVQVWRISRVFPMVDNDCGPRDLFPRRPALGIPSA